MSTSIRRRVLAACTAGVITSATLLALTAAPASAYGKANWQLTFAGTANVPSTGTSFGFWGWCDLAGGTTSGNAGDCQIAQYVHMPAGSGFTCHVNIDLTAWTAAATFLITGTATVNPTAETTPCLSLFPGGSPFANVDSGIPAVPGHHDIGVEALNPAAVGEFNVTVTEVP